MSNYIDRPLIEYLPNALKDVHEFQAVMSGEQPDIFNLFANIEDALNNQFIESATKYGVARWEKILQITPKATATLDERKFTILSRLNEQLPYTLRALRNALKLLCGSDGFTLQLLAQTYKVVVRVALTKESNYNDVQSLLQKVVPANMIVDLSLSYNQHQTFMTYTHEQLMPYTHQQLRTMEGFNQ